MNRNVPAPLAGQHIFVGAREPRTGLDVRVAVPSTDAGALVVGGLLGAILGFGLGYAVAKASM